MTFLLCAAVTGAAHAQDTTRRDVGPNSASSEIANGEASTASARKHGGALSTDERLAVIASALDSKTPRLRNAIALIWCMPFMNVPASRMPMPVQTIFTRVSKDFRKFPTRNREIS